MVSFNSKVLLPLLVLIAIASFIFYWRVGVEKVPGDYLVKKGNYRLEDGQPAEALKEFSLALEKNPDHIEAHLGLAITLMQLGKDNEALEEFDKTIAMDPKNAVAFADKGILLDRIGRYQEALENYKKALSLDSELLEGPGFLWRFLRNISEKPPNVLARAQYLESELSKPEKERLLKVPEIDEKQRMYKVEN